MDQRGHGGCRPTRRTFLSGAGLVALGLAAGGATACASGPPAAAATMRVPGEDVALERVWMAWPSSATIWGSLLPAVQSDIATLARTIGRSVPVVMCADGALAATQARGRCGSRVTVIGSIPVDDCWMRDTGPVFRTDGSGGRDTVGLNFNGWGHRQIHGKDRRVAAEVASDAAVAFHRAGFVGEGGAIESDGDGTVMATTSSLVNPNRNPGLTQRQVEAAVLAAYGATKMVWLPGLAGRDITDDHVDATARFVRPGVVMVQVGGAVTTGAWAQNARDIRRTLSTATDAKGRRLEVLTVRGPDSLPRWPRGQWPMFLDSYLNWVVTPTAVVTVQFGDRASDAAARSAIARAFPGKSVVQLDLDRLYGHGGGGAHCVTQQEPQP